MLGFQIHKVRDGSLRGQEGQMGQTKQAILWVCINKFAYDQAVLTRELRESLEANAHAYIHAIFCNCYERRVLVAKELQP